MARSFNLTAEINLRAPGNLKTIVADIRRELGTVSANVNLKLDAKSAKSVSAVKTKLDAVNAVLVTAKGNTDALNSSLQGLSSALSSVGSSGLKGATSIKVTADSARAASQSIKAASSSVEEFGKQAFLAVKRFAAFSLAAGPIYSLVNAINSGFSAFIAFDRELVRLQQVTGKSSTELATLEKTIRSLATSLGVSSESLTQTAVTLAQAGLTASETKIALEALAKTELAPSFDNLAETTEGAIAAIRQFDLKAGDLEAALGSVNAVAAAFAVEADDLIAAIQRTGGVFAAASKGVSQGTDALNEFLAVFTSVRQTTRESAETIATGLRTIFTRIQRARTIDQLREFGIELTDLEGKFVGPFEAIRRLSEGLKQLDPRDIRFSSIVEELGGFRQIGKVIPLIQQFAVAQEALKVAQKGQGSLTDAQIIAQKSLANQIVKVKEQFLSLIAEVGKSEVFQSLFKIVINLTSGLIGLAGAFKPILPILAIVGAVKGVKALGDFGAGFFGSMSKGSARGTGENLGSSLTGNRQKEKDDVTSKASEAIKANTSALTNLTSAVQALTSKIGVGGTTLSQGGKVLGFNRGGVVPGSGKGDKVPALLEPGEVVMSNNAVNKYGRGNLVRMNKYVSGGTVETDSFTIDQLLKVSGAKSLQDAIGSSNIESGPQGDTVKIKIRNRDVKLTDQDFQNIWDISNAAAGSSKTGMFKSYVGVDVGQKNRDLLRQLNEKTISYKDLSETEQSSLAMFRSAEGRWGKAYEKVLINKLKGKWEDASSQSDYPIDIVRKAQDKSIRALGEAKFRTKPTDTINLVSKLLRYRIDRGSTNQYFKENDQENRDLDVILGKLDYFWAGDQKLDFYKWIQDKQNKKTEGFNTGGKIQKFKEGSRGGIDWKSLSQGRGKEGARGARDIIEPISSETYLKWAKGIYDEYDADPSLVMAIGAGGERVPPEIALANKLLTQYAFETGGAGLAVGKRFVRTPKERISDELRPFLVSDPSDPNEFGFFEDDIRKFGRSKVLSKAATAKLGRQSALEAAGARNAAYTNAESAIASFKETGVLDVDPSIMTYLMESIANPNSLPLEPKELDKLKKKLTKPNVDAFNALIGENKTPVSVQGQRTKLSEVFGKILETYGSDTSDLEIDNIIRGVGSKIQDKRFGGIIQKFMSGSAGGIMEQTEEEALPSDLAGLIKEIEKIGGTTALYDFVPKPEIESILKEKKVFPRPTAKQLVSSPWLTAKTPDLYGDRDKYIPALQEVIRRARPKFNTKQSGIQAQLLRNVQAASGQGYKFGLASIYGPNGELGYSSTSNAKKIKGPDGTEYLTQIIRKSLPERYLDAVRATSGDIAGVPARAAERLQYTDIFGTGGPLAFDFDETLVKGSDIPSKNPADYSDLNKVQEALKNAELTLLGKELQRRINEYPQVLDGIRVLTARPQSNAPYLASALARLGLPIPESKITGVSGGLNKVDNLSELETLIDDNLENVQSVMAGGKRAIPYFEPRQSDASSRSIQVMEGYALEEMVKSLGVNISPDDADPLRPIDYPSGLGSYARYWNLPPNIPTDTKRTNSSSAVNRLFDEAARFYAENFAIGGMVKLGKGGYSRSPSKLVPNDPSFDPGPMEVGSQGIDYRSILENSGLDLQNWLVNKLAFEAKTNQFSENEILEYARKTKEQMGSRPKTNVQNLLETLRQPERFAIGGLADATGAMQGLISGLYGNRSQEQTTKKQKNFGKVALRTGNRIQATYIKEGEAATARSGQVIADSIGGGLYAVQSSSATKGYGPKLYDIVMEAATAAGGMLTSDRRTVSDAAKGVWAYYFKNRSDVKKTPLDPENWVSNSRLLDEKLYGPPDTWPSATDPAWILQTGYSKAPSDINNTSLVQRLAGGGSTNTIPAMVSNGEAFVPPRVAKKIGYAKLDKMNQADRNGMKGFAGGGISVFKGPGNGTSDSIGPIGLPQGSYVIREKATKALGLSRGGSVGGVQRFALGGTPQDQEYLSIKAKQAGQSIEQFSKTLIYSTKDLARELKDSQKEAKITLKTETIALFEKFKQASPKTAEGIAERKSVIDAIKSQIQTIDPATSDRDSDRLAKTLISKMTGGSTFDDAVTSTKELSSLMTKSLSNDEAQTEALKRIASEKGLSPEIIERLLGNRARSNEDNNLSRLIDFFGGPLKATTRSMLLAASLLESGAKLFFGTSTKLSSTFSGVLGGLQGGAQGAAVVAEMDIAANVNEFGKFLESFGGRLGNVGTALQKFSGGIQAGAIAYAAVSGAIKGFASAFNQAKLEKQLLELGLATDRTKEAFERLQKNPTETNATLAQQALGQEMESMEGLRRIAAVDIRGKRSLDTARSLDLTGITSEVSGAAQEKDARKAFFDVSARRFDQFRTLGERRLNEVDPKQIENAVAQANQDDAGISRLAKELEDLKAAPTRDEAAITAKQGEIDAAQQGKAENLFRKSQTFGQIAALEGEQEALRQFYLNQAQTEEEKLQRLDALNGQFGDTEDERAKNQEKAINSAKRLAAAEAETELRTKLLSDATQQLNIQTENLLRTYSVASAILQRFGESIDLIKNSAESTAAALEGRAQIGDLDRGNERILGNIEAYSLEEVRAAAVQTGQLAGGGLPGQTLQNQVLTAKVLQEALPQALATTGSEDVGEVINKLEDSFNQAGVAFSEPIKQQLRDSLAAEVSSKEGVSFQKLANESEIVANLLKQTEAGLKAAQEFQKRYNDAIATAIQLQNGYAQALQQSIDYQIQSAEIRANADIQLKEALGQRVTSADRNAAFDTRIRTLTSTNIIPGGTTDPEKIFQQLTTGVVGQKAQQDELDRRKQDFAASPTEANKARVAEQMQSMAKQNVAINNSRKALEELANDGSKAANALRDLQDIDRVASGATNFTRDVLTSNPEDLAKINKQLLSFTKFRSGQATAGEVNNLEFRQNAFAGGDLIKSVLPKEIADQLDAQLSLDMLRSTPGSAKALSAIVGKGPQGEGITLESALQMKAGGIDPVQEKYIKAYQDAVDVQAQAAAKLGEAAQQVAQTFNDKMIQVLTEIQQQLPNILEQSVAAGMTPSVAAAYKELNLANKERQALDTAQAGVMGLDATQFNAVNAGYDAVITSRKRTSDLELSQSQAQGFANVEAFRESDKYNTFINSDQYKQSVDAQTEAEQNFKSIATAAKVSPEIAQDISTYRSGNAYTQATAKIAEKESALAAAQTGPQPAEKPRAKALEETAKDTTAIDAERQKQKSDDDFKSGVLSFGGHVLAFAAAVTAFAGFNALSAAGGLRGLFGGRGGRARGAGVGSPSVRPSVRAGGSPATASGPARRAAGAAPSTPQSGPPRRAAGAAPSTPLAGPPRRGGTAAAQVRPTVSAAPATPSTPAAKPSAAAKTATAGAAAVAGKAIDAVVDKVSVLDEVVGVATSATNIASGQGTVQDVVYGASDAAELAGRGGGLFNFLNKIPGVGALTKGVGSAAGSIGTRLGVGGLVSAAGGGLSSFGSAIGIGKPILGASGGIGAGLGNFAALNTAISGVKNTIEFLSDPEAYSARKQAQSDAGLQRAQERTGYGEFALDSLGGALEGFTDPIGKIVEGGYVVKDLVKDRAAASEAQAKTERISEAGQKQVTESRGGGAIGKLAFDEQRKAMEEAQIKSELVAAQRVQATGGSLGDVAKIFDTSEQSLGATNLQDFIAKREARLKELPQDRIDSRERAKDGTWDWSSNMDPKGFAEAVAQEVEYRLSQVQLPPVPVKPEIEDDTKLQIDGKVAKDTDISKTTEQKTSTEASKAVDTITSSSTLASKALDTMATSTQRFIDVISGRGQQPTAAGTQTNAQSVVYSASGPALQQTNQPRVIPAPTPPGANVAPVIQSANVAPQIGIQPQIVQAQQGAAGLEPRPEIALKQAETQLALDSGTQPQVSQAPVTESVKLREDRQIVIDANRKAKQKKVDSLKKAVEAAEKNVGVNKIGGATGEKSKAVLADKQAKLVAAQQDLSKIDSQERDELEEVRKNQQLRADLSGKQIQYTTQQTKPQTSSEQKKPLSPYEAEQKAKRDAFESNKKARRGAYLSRFRPEVAERMMTDEEKTSRRDASRLAAGRATQQNAITATPPTTPTSPSGRPGPGQRPQTAAQELFNGMNMNSDAAYAMRYSNPGVRAAMSPEDRARAERGDAQNNLRPSSQPIPTPLQTTQTSPQFAAAQTVAADQGASVAAQQYTLSLDPASLTAFTEIQASFTEFGKYVSQLANIKLPNKIEITGGGTYTMDVNITGAAAMEMLETKTKELAEKFIVTEIQQLKDKLNKVFPSEFKASGSGGESAKP